MRSISLKLTLAFLMISLAGTILAAIFVRWSTVRAFDTYVRSQERSIFVSNAQTYYEAVGSWVGFAAFTHDHFPPPDGSGHPEDQYPNNYPLAGDSYPQAFRPTRLPFVLADQNGNVVLPSGRYQTGMTISELTKDRE